MKPVRTWVVIADASRARVLQQEGKNAPLAPVDGMAMEADLKPTHEIMSDRAGRNASAGAYPKHAFDARTDAHRLEKRRFAELVVGKLGACHAAGDFDRLVIVAPPQALGDLRAALGPHLSAAVHAEVPKDLTKTPDHELPGQLDDVLI